MAQFSGMVLTNQGLQLQARAQTGAQLQFTSVKLGDGELATGQSLETMTGLVSPKLSLAIQSMEVIGDGTSRVRVVLTNTDITTGFFVREIGVYAHDAQSNTDVLYSVSNAGDMADFLPAGGAETVVEQVIDLITVVGNAQNVTAAIDKHTMIATLEDLEVVEAKKLSLANPLASGAVYHYRDVAAFGAVGGGTGTVKITLPVSWNSTILNIKIRGYDYATTAGAWDAEIGGFNHIISAAWLRTSAVLSPYCPVTSVRFGHDGTKCCILLGTTTSTWNNYEISISDVVAAYVGQSQLSAGWSIGLITDETGITVSSTPTVKTLATLENPKFTGNVTVGNTFLVYPISVKGRIFIENIDNTITGALLSADGGAASFASYNNVSSGYAPINFMQYNQAGNKIIAAFDSSGNLKPFIDNTYSLGASSYRWSQLWAASATINTSDENAKTEIVDTALGLDFVNKLHPVEFKYKVRQNEITQEQDGTEIVTIPPVTDDDGNIIIAERIEEVPKYKEVITPLPGIRTHLGLIAQEVETALNGKDCAIFTRDTENGLCGLRYEELVAPLIKAVQELSAKVEVQAEEITALKAKTGA